MGQKVKLLYIAGSSRSGSTLLARLLGELDGFLNIGEAARNLFDARFIAEDLPCGCGEKIQNCRFWKDIVTRIPSDLQKLVARYMRMRYYPWITFSGKPKLPHLQLEMLKSALSDFYSSLFSREECEVIVDSSKDADFAFLLNQIPTIELYVIHLVRDPRAVVSSWRRPKGYLHARSPIKVIVGWNFYNILIEILQRQTSRYLRIGYEHFVETPERTVRKIAHFVGRGNINVDFIKGKQAEVSRQHILAGNPEKLVQGSITIQRRHWSLPWHLQALVLLACFPLYSRYYLFSTEDQEWS